MRAVCILTEVTLERVRPIVLETLSARKVCNPSPWSQNSRSPRPHDQITVLVSLDEALEARLTMCLVCLQRSDVLTCDWALVLAL